MSGELATVPVDLADHLTAELAALDVEVTVAPWPPDGVGEPAAWVELASGATAATARTVRLEVVVVVPAGHRRALAGLTDVLWSAIDTWRPEPLGIAVDRNGIDWSAGTELVATDSLPGARFSIPFTYRPC